MTTKENIAADHMCVTFIRIDVAGDARRAECAEPAIRDDAIAIRVPATITDAVAAKLLRQVANHLEHSWAMRTWTD